jgi:hypothetical protein
MRQRNGPGKVSPGAAANDQTAAKRPNPPKDNDPQAPGVDVADNDAQLARLAAASDDVLAAVLRHDTAVRRALRHSPPHETDRSLDQARTLVAVARITRRRRQRSDRLLADVLAAARGGR